MKEICNLTYRTTNFSLYPEHVRNLYTYAWKPLVIQVLFVYIVEYLVTCKVSHITGFNHLFDFCIIYFQSHTSVVHKSMLSCHKTKIIIEIAL